MPAIELFRPPVAERRYTEPKYQEWMDEAIMEVARSGGYDAAMCEKIGVSNTTLIRWKKEIPEFNKAYQESRTASRKFYEDLLLKGATGQIHGFNFHALAMIMNNKFPEDYSRSANNSKTDVTINTINISPEQLQAQIAQKLEKLKSLGIDSEIIDVE